MNGSKDSKEVFNTAGLLRALRIALGDHYSNCASINCRLCELWPSVYNISTELDGAEEEREKRERFEADRQEEINLGKQVMGDD